LITLWLQAVAVAEQVTLAVAVLAVLEQHQVLQ
jgi:hypothetical protein